ncbi:MAG: DUF6711 family protein [Porcipelethomonas sp.]
MIFLEVNGIALPNPRSYSVQRSDLDSENTSRSESGILNRERIRFGVRKIQVSWIKAHSEIQAIVDALSPDRFNVTFYDPYNPDGYYSSAQMYAGDITTTMTLIKDDMGKSLWETSCSLVQY